ARSGRSSSSLGVCSALSTALPGSGQTDHGKEHGGGPTDEGAPRQVVDGADVGDEFGCFLTTGPVGSLLGKIVGARDRLVEACGLVVGSTAVTVLGPVVPGPGVGPVHGGRARAVFGVLPGRAVTTPIVTAVMSFPRTASGPTGPTGTAGATGTASLRGADGCHARRR